ncbi:penicillin-binding protein [Candidatus Arthromitus sp. SFB-mouse-Japan]|uniref:penicillin-binding transpeptidase domain-containing protein n=1 Tax=Candidatus Arthromitus sp. SFB-mouse TaxID=49118 RepID=UPI00021B7E5B|nr:penicillin-binding transpeptidase domain-containing protein [Candidatus Arthromitus sp. SFB-mouse]EIA24118.1 Putative penicillin-binding protein [Candidatus Arthromitus sp. SFB-2]EIA27384.1 Putative penicillin-binding protein [Candidatus Arthromitus sp. SFB-5]EIA27776.1 Putative penicillin-binding protein [Candidatus Arthromitus sp. SFB-co]EIA29635.1 Putative penicillin-binding protein [Candidatus Arthromitus sp. SFB-4]EIA30464.1 Putative penicillin-binding protein [Candidatus Arthromitus s
MFVLFFIIIIRLFNLQIIGFEDNLKLSTYYSQRQVSIRASRGEILDKNGEVLATNVESYILEYSGINNSDSFFEVITEVLDILDKNGEDLYNNFEIKVDPFRFEFAVTSESEIRGKELRFKNDRGYYDKLKKKYFSSIRDLTDNQKRELEDSIINIKAEDMFYDLIEEYDLYKLLDSSFEMKNSTGKEIYDKLIKKFTPKRIRDYVFIRDSIKMNSFSGFNPIILAIDLDKETAFEIMQKEIMLKGITVSPRSIRYYPEGEFASNIIGYIGAIDDNQKEKYQKDGYNTSYDTIGKSGIEAIFESNLRGKHGSNIIKVDNNGTKKEDIMQIDPIPGDNIYLTIDKKLQKVTERALNDVMTGLQNTGNGHGTGLDTSNATRGAAVVIDVNNGDILSLVSLPNYDPNVFVSDENMTPDIRKQYFATDLKEFGEEYIESRKLNIDVDELFPLSDINDPNSLREDPNDVYPKVFFNYATQGLIPPGSTFKPLTAIAALEEGVIGPNETIKDNLVFEAYNNKWTNLVNYTLGDIDVRDALRSSNNHYFYQVAYRLYNKEGFSNKEGLDILAKWAWQFGLGRPPNTTNYISTTGIELIETTGQVFNLQSMKSNVIALSTYNIIDILNKGEFGRYIFNPIDISKKTTDSEKLSKLKKEIKDFVKKILDEDLPLDVDKGILKEKTDYLNSNLNMLFSDIVNYYNEESDTEYTNNDIENMTNAITEYTIYSLRTEIYTPGNVINASIGQGISLFTPIQLANYIATLVNGGIRYKLNLVDKIVDIDNNIVKEYKPEILDKVILKSENVDAVIEGMRRVTRNGSTASVFTNGHYFPIETGGKTGTATFKENGMQERVGRAAYGVFVGFAPIDDPKIAVCVVIYDGGHGYFSSYVARAIFEAYFKDELQKNYPEYIPMFPYAYTLMD